VLAPGEETVVFDDPRADHHHLDGPTHIEVALLSTAVDPSDDPFLPDPLVLTTRFVDAGLAMEVKNSGPHYYGAITGTQPAPFKAVIVLYKDGRISGAERVRVDRGWRMGHVVPGQVVEFDERVDMHDGYDDYRVLFAVEPLPEGMFPRRMDVRIDRWWATCYDWCSPRGGCRAVEFVTTASNLADGPVKEP